jgi:hypothetical protein
MNKPYNIQNTNICNGIFHISFFKAIINEGETTQGEKGIGGETTWGANRIQGETTRYRIYMSITFSGNVIFTKCYASVNKIVKLTDPQERVDRILLGAPPPFFADNIYVL